MAYGGAPGRRAGEEAFFSPMGAQLPAVIGGQPAGAGPPPLALGRGVPPSSTAAGTHSKLAAQDVYWRWFQMADRGALPCFGLCSHPGAPACILLCQLASCMLVLRQCLHFGFAGLLTMLARLLPAHARVPALMPADRDGRLVGADAVQFFERSGLPREILAKVGAGGSKQQGRSSIEELRITILSAIASGCCMPLTYAPCTVAVQVWAAADNKRQGFLDFNAFVKALELMSLAQVGAQLTPGAAATVPAGCGYARISIKPDSDSKEQQMMEEQ